MVSIVTGKSCAQENVISVRSCTLESKCCLEWRQIWAEIILGMFGLVVRLCFEMTGRSY